MTVDQILIAMRQAGTNSYSWSLPRREAEVLVAEVERLRDTVAALRASVPPTHPADYGHEVWTAALVEAKKEGARSAVAERAAERAAVVACLRLADDVSPYDEIAAVIAFIERGGHRREEKE